MPNEIQSYFSADSALTTLNTALSSNATDIALVKTYSDSKESLYAATGSAESTAAESPTQVNLDAVVTAWTNFRTQSDGNGRAAIIGAEAIRQVAFDRTIAPLKAALLDAVAKLDAAITAIGYTSAVTVANVALRDRLTDGCNKARKYYELSAAWTKIEQCQGAIDFLTA
jgi:hypothetical protein